MLLDKRQVKINYGDGALSLRSINIIVVTGPGCRGLFLFYEMPFTLAREKKEKG